MPFARSRGLRVLARMAANRAELARQPMEAAEDRIDQARVRPDPEDSSLCTENLAMNA